MSRTERTAVFVYKTGPKFNEQDVRKLIAGCKRNCITDFIVLTDDKTLRVPADIVLLTDNLPGFWSKMELFKLPAGKYLYIDLDSVVQKTLRHIYDYNHTFTMIRNLDGNDNACSGVMCWEGDYSYIYNKFISNKERYINEYVTYDKWGDQGCIRDLLGFKPDYLQDLFANSVSSYKLDTNERKEQSNIVCWHGEPSASQCNWDIYN